MNTRLRESEQPFFYKHFIAQLKEAGFWKYHFLRVHNELRIANAELSALKKKCLSSSKTN